MCAATNTTSGNTEYELMEEIGVEVDTSVPSRTYRIDFNTGRISGMIEDSVMVQAVRKIIETPEITPIYMSGYGIDLASALGKRPAELKAEVTSALRNALALDDRVIGVNVTEAYQERKDAIVMTVEVRTTEGIVEVNSKVVV